MPVMGKRYRATGANEFIPNKHYIMRCDKILSNEVILDKNTRGNHIRFPIDDFFKYFEEIPEDNLQKAGYRDKAEIWKLLDYNKKYKEKNSNKIVKLNSIGTAEVMFRYEGKNYNEGQFHKCSPNTFLNFFEKLPEDNLQKPEEVHSVGKEANCKNCKKVFNQRHSGDHFCCNYCRWLKKEIACHTTYIGYNNKAIISDDQILNAVGLRPNPVDFEEEKVNEINRALKKLKLKLNEFEDNHSGWCESEYHFELLNSITNVINAWYSLYEEGGNEEVQPEFWLEGSKEEPKIEMKEERVEPVSIWKDGDELKELEKQNEKFLIRTKDGRVLMPMLSNIFTDDNEINKNIKEVTTLTDFINSFDQMQKDIKELKTCKK
jgi:hypothetical protein